MRGKAKNLFTSRYVQRKLIHVVRQDTMSQKTDCKVFEGWTALWTSTCCSSKVHSNHRVLIAACGGRM